MPNVAHKIVCASETLCADRGAELFAQMFIAEAVAASKSGQSELTVERSDISFLAREVSMLSEAHERSLGDTSIIALDAASAIACANYRLNVLASYDFFDDIEYLAQRVEGSPDALRCRLHTALCRADKLIVVDRKALQMAWLYLDDGFIQQPLPPLSAYSNALCDMTQPILIVVHQSEIPAAKESAAQLHAIYPNSIVVDARANEQDKAAPACIALAVHIGHGTRARAGLRIVDCWSSEIPVVQLALRTANPGASADDEFLSDTLVSHNETGLLAANVAELNRHVAAVMSDPVLYATLARRAKIEAAKQAHLWRELVHRIFHEEQE